MLSQIEECPHCKKHFDVFVDSNECPHCNSPIKSTDFGKNIIPNGRINLISDTFDTFVGIVLKTFAVVILFPLCILLVILVFPYLLVLILFIAIPVLVFISSEFFFRKFFKTNTFVRVAKYIISTSSFVLGVITLQVVLKFFMNDYMIRMLSFFIDYLTPFIFYIPIALFIVFVALTLNSIFFSKSSQ